MLAIHFAFTVSSHCNPLKATALLLLSLQHPKREEIGILSARGVYLEDMWISVGTQLSVKPLKMNSIRTLRSGKFSFRGCSSRKARIIPLHDDVL